MNLQNVMASWQNAVQLIITGLQFLLQNSCCSVENEVPLLSTELRSILQKINLYLEWPDDAVELQTEIRFTYYL